MDPVTIAQNQAVYRVPETIPPSQAKSPPAGPLTALRTYNTPIPRIKDAFMHYWNINHTIMFLIHMCRILSKALTKNTKWYIPLLPPPLFQTRWRLASSML